MLIPDGPAFLVDDHEDILIVTAQTHARRDASLTDVLAWRCCLLGFMALGVRCPVDIFAKSFLA